MTQGMGQKIVLAGMACKDWILPNFNLDLYSYIISLLCSNAILSCMQFRSVCGMLELFCPSMVAVACRLGLST